MRDLILEQIISVQVDCEWGIWGEWGDCDKQCDLGYRSRTRAPSQNKSNGGEECEGPSSSNEPCNLRPCQGIIQTQVHINSLQFSRRMVYLFQWIANGHPGEHGETAIHLAAMAHNTDPDQSIDGRSMGVLNVLVTMKADRNAPMDHVQVKIIEQG